MKKLKRRLLALLVLLVALSAMTSLALADGDPTEQPGTKMIECPDCGGSGACMTCCGLDPECPDCGGENVCQTCGGTGYVESPSHFYNTAWSLLPPVICKGVIGINFLNPNSLRMTDTEICIPVASASGCADSSEMNSLAAVLFTY